MQCLGTLGNTLFACSSEPSAHAVTGAPFILGASTDEGSTFAPVLTLAGIRGPLQCPHSAIATTKCVPEWPVLAEQLAIDAGAPDAGSEPGKTGGCGCDASEGSGSAGLLLIALVAALAGNRRLRLRD